MTPPNILMILIILIIQIFVKWGIEETIGPKHSKCIFPGCIVELSRGSTPCEAPHRAGWVARIKKERAGTRCACGDVAIRGAGRNERSSSRAPARRSSFLHSGIRIQDRAEPPRPTWQYRKRTFCCSETLRTHCQSSLLQAQKMSQFCYILPCGFMTIPLRPT